MSRTETIDDTFHVHKWGNANYLLSTSHSGDVVLEWLNNNKSTELEVRV